MNDFIRRYQDELSGSLSGFDRLVFRGGVGKDQITGMKGYLWAQGLGAKDFGTHAEQISQQMKEASLAPVLAAGRSVLYLNSGKEDKQQLALQIAARDGVVAGPICVLSAVELCRSYAIKRNPKTQRPELTLARRKCLFLYHYFIHPVFGFMSARLQTWFPFSLHLYMNGREWLARQMDQAGIGYRRHDNCFTWVEDVERAQTLLGEQLKTNWVQLFDPIARQVHPLLFSNMCVNYPMKYFWTCQDSEWAIDLMFRNSEQLRRLVPPLLHLGVVSFSSPGCVAFHGQKSGSRRQSCRWPQIACQFRPQSPLPWRPYQASPGAELSEVVRQSLRRVGGCVAGRAHDLAAQVFPCLSPHRRSQFHTRLAKAQPTCTIGLKSHSRS